MPIVLCVFRPITDIRMLLGRPLYSKAVQEQKFAAAVFALDLNWFLIVKSRFKWFKINVGPFRNSSLQPLTGLWAGSILFRNLVETALTRGHVLSETKSLKYPDKVTTKTMLFRDQIKTKTLEKIPGNSCGFCLLSVSKEVKTFMGELVNLIDMIFFLPNLPA